MNRFATFLTVIAAMLLEASAFGSTQHSRNDFFKQISSSVIAFGSATTTGILKPDIANAQQGILRSDKCAYGEGLGCDSLAGDNDFIKDLQRKSAERKEAEQKEYVSAYQMKNYPDFFASLSPPKYMVKKSDGTFDLYDDVELAKLKKENKIRLEKPTAMGGRVVDVTQKPVLVLVE